MTIGAYELLTRHVQDSGPLQGKVLSDITLPMEARPGLSGVRWFDLPDTSGKFKELCREPLVLGFRKPHRLLPATHSFIESGYRGLKEAGALLIELVFRNGDEIFFEIDSPGKADTKPFGGREGQARFDATNKYRAKLANVYRLRQYVLVGTIFSSMDELGGYVARYHKRYLGELLKGRDVSGLTLNTTTQTTPVSRRMSEPWFTAKMNHWLPKEFVDSLDEDALALLFPPSFVEKHLENRKVAKGKVQMTPETRKAMLKKVRQERGFIPGDDEELIQMYEDLPDAEPVEYQRGYAMGVEMLCSLAVELRVVRGGAVLKAMTTGKAAWIG